MPMVPDRPANDLAQVREMSDSEQQRARDFVTEQPIFALALTFFLGILFGKLVL